MIDYDLELFFILVYFNYLYLVISIIENSWTVSWKNKTG